MKLTLAIVAALAFASPAFALPTEFCVAMSEGAENIMLARQRGKRVAEVLAVIEDKDSEIGQLYVAMIDAAYDAPQMSMPENQERSASEFAAVVYSACRSEDAL